VTEQAPATGAPRGRGGEVSDGVVPIAVREYGERSGRCVAVLHGGPGAPGSVASLARQLSDRFHVLEPLQRGSGAVPLTVAQHVDDLARVLPGRMPIVGWSWGAMLGLSFAVDHPDFVQSLVLIGCGTYDRSARATFASAMSRRLGADGRRRMAELRAAFEATSDPAMRDDLLAQLGALSMQAQSVALIEANTSDLVADARGHEETWNDVLRRQDADIEPQAFAAIRVPVLMIHGDDDPHPGVAIRETLRPFLPQLEYVGIARCGHLPWLEQDGREPCLRALRTWLRARAAVARTGSIP
jgi:pimeloyl-ACP methyl ester carboxylesterase